MQKQLERMYLTPLQLETLVKIGRLAEDLTRYELLGVRLRDEALCALRALGIKPQRRNTHPLSK